MAEYQILWTRHEEPDPEDPEFVHIREVGVGNWRGEYLGAWPAAKVIARINAGDRFLVAAVVWAPVEVKGAPPRQYLQSAANGLAITNLQNLHEHAHRRVMSP